jgi:hypothetical protein
MEVDLRELTDLGEQTPESKMRLAIQTGIILADRQHYCDCTGDRSSLLDIC